MNFEGDPDTDSEMFYYFILAILLSSRVPLPYGFQSRNHLKRAPKKKLLRLLTIYKVINSGILRVKLLESQVHNVHYAALKRKSGALSSVCDANVLY